MVIRRPLLFALPVVVVLLGLGIPFLKVQFANPDERALPTDSNARLVAESLREDYPLDPSQAITLVTRKDEDVLKTLAAEVSQMDNVVLVNGSIGKYAGGRARRPDTRQARHDGAAYAFVYLRWSDSRTQPNTSCATSARRSPTSRSRSAVRPPRSSTAAPPSPTGLPWRSG